MKKANPIKDFAEVTVGTALAGTTIGAIEKAPLGAFKSPTQIMVGAGLLGHTAKKAHKYFK